MKGSMGYVYRTSKAFAAALASVAMLAFAVGLDGRHAAAGIADDAFLQSIAGDWRGSGRARARIDAERERVNCRLEALWDEDWRRLSMNFDCRGIDFEFSSSGFLASLPRDTYLEGQWRGTGRVGQADVFGQRDGSALALTLTSRDERSGEETVSMLSIELSETGELVNVISAVDRTTQQEFDMLSLVMRR
jgi:hypothetical protein